MGPGHAHGPDKDAEAQGDEAACPRSRLTTGQGQGWSGGSLSSECVFTAIKQTPLKTLLPLFFFQTCKIGILLGSYAWITEIISTCVFQMYFTGVQSDLRTARNVSVDVLSQQSPPYFTLE